MNITDLEQKYGQLPPEIDRKQMETLLRKNSNPYPLLNKPLAETVEAWLNEAKLTYTTEKVPYNYLDGTQHYLTAIIIEKSIALVLVDNYASFCKRVVHKGIAGKIHKELLAKHANVVWCKKFEWENPRKQKVMQSLILHMLGKTPNRVYARNTVCEVVEAKTLKTFFDESSFYGNRNASHAVVLKDKNTQEVLMAMSFGLPYYSKGKYGENAVECIRSAGKPFYAVVGGMSKLMKFYLEKFQDKIDSILFYTDTAHHHSSSMAATGFEYLHFSDNAVHNVWAGTEAMLMRTPALHGSIKYLQKVGEIYGVPDVGSDTYLYNVKKNNESSPS